MDVPEANAVMMTEASTPLMRQYAAIKKQHPNALLFFRLGDFYELFFEDAVVASRELQITLTSRNKEKDQAIPMCGVPYHAAEGYLAKLLRKGFRVAICEQMEDPKLAKKIVRREVTRVLTPGTSADASLASEENNFLAAIAQLSDRAGLAALDLSTGEFRATEFALQDRGRLLEELSHIRPREVLYPAALPLFAAGEAEISSTAGGPRFTETPVEDWAFSPDYAIPLLENQFGVLSLEGFGLATREAAATAAGAILHYVRSTQRGTLEHVDRIGFYNRQDCLVLDAVTVRNLELVEPLFSGTGPEVTLFRTLDATLTPMGKRLLRSWLLRPSIDLNEIHARQDATAVAVAKTIDREELRRKLERVLDLERLLSRVTLETANARDLLALASSVAHLPEIKAGLQGLHAARFGQLNLLIDSLTDIRERIDRTIVPEPPLSFADGGIIRSSIDAELDELRDLSRNSKQYIAQIEDRERQRTGINSLKIKFNSVFGYYMEVTKPNLHLVPADFERKQTLVNAERFTTPELKQYETKVLEAEEKIVEIERRLFTELRMTIAAEAKRIRQTSLALAEVDVLLALANIAAERGYTRPVLDDSGVIELVESRHPVVEQQVMSGTERFVPNDLLLNPESDLIVLLTGPNMGGKSTYLRQTALIVIMAQMGSFVPARAARVGIVDRIFTRIGASDNLARGRSTFMVEMTETAAILNTATPRSLVLLDEMGRGTATYDGLALAWATLEYLHSVTKAKTLFATHYHELTALAEEMPLLRNYRVSIKETPAGIVFLRKVEPGAADKSYGIEVAKLAGLPMGVIRRAREVLAQHEGQELQSVKKLDGGGACKESASLQLAIFTPLSQHIVDQIKEVDVNRLTPIEALTLLDQLKRQLA
ncbi:MAG TPA: DNA mismatch repair protein MutS [Terriglobales bacterium]|nr:DNA mismatch repair protein MutS [Terriglobales bacterium]